MVNHRSRLAALFLASALVLVACGGSSSTGASGDGATDGPPAFSAATVDGGELASASFAGEPTVLWFWAPWCTVCRAEAPDVAEAASDFDGDVELVGVAGRGSVEEMKGFVSDTGTDAITHVVDGDDGRIWADYGVTAQPAFAFIDAEGNVEVTAGSMGKDALEQKMTELAKA